MSRDLGSYLEDIVGFCDRISEVLRDLSFEEAAARRDVGEIAMYNFLLLGEAVKHLPSSIRKRRHEIPWRKIAGLRDVLVHDYPQVKFSVVWNAAQEELPILRQAAIDLLRELDNSAPEAND
jgi:uncharacterized protein with HEPN domain